MSFGLIRQELILGRLISVKKDGKVVWASSLPKPKAIGFLSLGYSLLALERCALVWLKELVIRLGARGRKQLSHAVCFAWWHESGFMRGAGAGIGQERKKDVPGE